MTEQEYIANIAARFPKCVTASGLAIPDRLAARENAAAKIKWYRTGPAGVRESAERVHQRRLGWATILARISPVTSVAAADALGVPTKSISDRMDALEQSGFAKRISRSPLVWEVRIQEAAE